MFVTFFELQQGINLVTLYCHTQTEKIVTL